MIRRVSRIILGVFQGSADTRSVGPAYNGVIGVLQVCYSGVIEESQGCYRSVTEVLQYAHTHSVMRKKEAGGGGKRLVTDNNSKASQLHE
jgi:hypothetical protein